MPLTSTGETLALAAVLDGTYLALNTGDPGNTGANEVVAADYARQAATFENTGANPTTAANDAVIQFPQAETNWGTITHFTLWSASTGGSCVAYGNISTAKPIIVGDVARWDVGTLTVRAD